MPPSQHKGVMDAFVAILAAFCLAGKFSHFVFRRNWFINSFLWHLQKAGSYRVGASYCVSDKNGLCSWTAPIDCENPELYCGPGAQCLIVSKSINASYDSSSGANQQFQCRCPVGAPIGDCNPYPSQGNLFIFFYSPPQWFLLFEPIF